jgi:hypothetical protein
VAPPPPNRMAALNTNTMGNGPHIRFGQNQLQGQVIVGGLMKLLNTIFLHMIINWDMANCFACGAAAPKKLGGASSQHHGQCPPHLVWSESMVGVSNWGVSDDVTRNDFFSHDNQLQIWPITSTMSRIPPNLLAALHLKTMGDAPHVRFGRNRQWGHVILGDLPI